LPTAEAISYPLTCSSEDRIFLGVYAFDQEGKEPLTPFPDLYRVSPQREVKRISRPVPANYKHLDNPSFFAGEHTLVSLIRASQPIDKTNSQSLPVTDLFLAVTDADGDHPELIPLKLPATFGVLKAAAFESGQFLVLGTDRKTFQPVVALVNHNGELKKYLDVFQESGEPGPAKEPDSADEKARQRTLLNLLGAAEFAPWGTDIVMAAPGVDKSSVYRFRASGVVDRVLLKLLNHEQVEGILGSGGKDTWVIRTRSAESARKFLDSHIVENPEEFLYEVDPRSGELLRRLDVAGPTSGEVACAADGKLTAIYVGKPPLTGAPELILFASAPR
jgi:hypothetical protein